MVRPVGTTVRGQFPSSWFGPLCEPVCRHRPLVPPTPPKALGPAKRLRVVEAHFRTIAEYQEKTAAEPTAHDFVVYANYCDSLGLG